MNVGPALIRPPHEPDAGELLPMLPDIGNALAESLALLSAAPSTARATQVLAQIGGAQVFVSKLRTALLEAAE